MVFKNFASKMFVDSSIKTDGQVGLGQLGYNNNENTNESNILANIAVF